MESAVAQGRKALDLETLLARANAGAQVVDARDPEAFAAGHLAGSINIGLDGKFATWAGTVLDLERPILVIAEAGREEEAILRLGRIGLDLVEGYLDGGAAAFTERPELQARFARVEAEQLAEELAGEAAPVVLDVRAPGEYGAGHLECALHIPLNQLAERASEVPRDRPVVVHCAGGYRSAIAVSLLERAGVEGLRDLRGGFGAWSGAGMPVVVPAPTA
jgi:rhodanese-related sulfurtransferase